MPLAGLSELLPDLVERVLALAAILFELSEAQPQALDALYDALVGTLKQ